MWTKKDLGDLQPWGFIGSSWHHRLVLGMWNITSLVGKEPELVLEVKRYKLDIVVLISTNSTGSGSNLLEKGWTFSFSRVA